MPETHTCFARPCLCFSLPDVKWRLTSIARGSSHPAYTPARRRKMVEAVEAATTVDEANAVFDRISAEARAKWKARLDKKFDRAE